MARKPKQSDAKSDILAIALDLAAEQRWRRIDPVAIASRAGCEIAEVQAVARNRHVLLRSLARRLDAAVLAVPVDDLLELNVRERLFELVMRRLEVMRPWKPAMLALAQSRDPCLAMAAARQLDSFASILVSVGGTGLTGLRALVGAGLLKLAYASVVRVWLRDDTEDGAATLAELDKRLAQLEKLVSTAQRFTRRPAAAQAAAA